MKPNAVAQIHCDKDCNSLGYGHCAGLKLGDVLTVAAPHETAVVRVIGLGERRGDASSVAALYVRVAGQ
jgi:ribosomal 50S subunit-recycling heat shock protein